MTLISLIHNTTSAIPNENKNKLFKTNSKEENNLQTLFSEALEREKIEIPEGNPEIEQNKIDKINHILFSILPDFFQPEKHFSSKLGKWTKEDKFYLLINLIRNESKKNIGTSLNRTPKTINSFLKRLKIEKTSDWTPDNKCQILKALANNSWDTFVNTLIRNRENKKEKAPFINLLARCNWLEEQKKTFTSTISNQCKWTIEHLILFSKTTPVSENYHEDITSLLNKILKKKSARKNRILFLRTIASGEDVTQIHARTKLKNKTILSFLENKELKNYIDWPNEERNYMLDALNIYEKTVLALGNQSKTIKDSALINECELETGFNRDFVDLWDEYEATIPAKIFAKEEDFDSLTSAEKPLLRSSENTVSTDNLAKITTEQEKKIEFVMNPILEGLFPDFFNPTTNLPYTISESTEEDKFNLLISFARKDSRETIRKTIHLKRNTFNKYLSKTKLTNIENWTQEDHGQMLNLLARKSWTTFINILKSNRKDKEEKDDFFIVLANCKWTKEEKENLISAVSVDCNWKGTQITNFLNSDSNHLSEISGDFSTSSSNTSECDQKDHIETAFNTMFKGVSKHRWTNEAKISLLRTLAQSEPYPIKSLNQHTKAFLRRKKLTNYAKWTKEEKAYLLAALQTYETSVISAENKSRSLEINNEKENISRFFFSEKIEGEGVKKPVESPDETSTSTGSKRPRDSFNRTNTKLPAKKRQKVSSSV